MCPRVMILGFFADLDRWAYENGVELDFSRPGKPTHNAIIKSFNRSFGDECLNVHWFYLRLSEDHLKENILIKIKYIAQNILVIIIIGQ